VSNGTAATADSGRYDIGPSPAGSIACFPCLAGRCGHSPAILVSSVHGGGYIPAVTYCGGSALCQDCAMREAEYLPEPVKRPALGSGTATT
jgi:hypothetical protein